MAVDPCGAGTPRTVISSIARLNQRQRPRSRATGDARPIYRNFPATAEILADRLLVRRQVPLTQKHPHPRILKISKLRRTPFQLRYELQGGDANLRRARCWVYGRWRQTSTPQRLRPGTEPLFEDRHRWPPTDLLP